MIKNKFKLESWDSIKKKPFKIMLTEKLVKEAGWPLVYENGGWWVEIDLSEQKKKDPLESMGRNIKRLRRLRRLIC